MFWDDIKLIKEWLKTADQRLINLEMNCGAIQDCEDHLICMNDIIKELYNDSRREKQVLLAEKTLDKFEDYMKNIDKLNLMINEFKGCISIARAGLKDKKTPKNEEKPKKKGNSSKKVPSI